MELTLEFISKIIANGFRRCELAKLAGGIAHRNVVDGTPVPQGWTLDPLTGYWLPPLIRLDTDLQ